MTDKQQIEDIAMELYNNQDKIDVTNPYEVADLIYNANYRKVPENAVVLTEEEYNALMLEQKRLKEMVDRIPCGYELKDKTRKETADKIFDILYQWLDLEQIEKYGFVTIQKFDFLRKFREIFKQFRVEVEE